VPLTRTILASLFADVKRKFFPRFDRAGRWKCRVGSFTTVHDEVGYCDDVKKVLFVSRQVAESRNYDLLLVVLIHEITHAVLGDGSHGKRFIARLETAMSLAEQLGRPSLAVALKGEIHGYRRAERVSAAGVYADLRDLIAEARPASFEAARRMLRQRYPEHFLARCRRLEAVFNEAKGVTGPA